MRFSARCFLLLYYFRLGRLERRFASDGINSLSVDSIEREPWPPKLIEIFRNAYPFQTRERMLFELMLGTGQRIGDCLEMHWSHLVGSDIWVKQNKTKKSLLIPVTRELSEALSVHRAIWDAAETDHKGLFILQKDMTKTKQPGPWAYRGAAEAKREARKQVGAQKFDNHAIRYTAATELLRAGCSDEQIAAVTGQSIKMVQHYTRAERQKLRARTAQAKRATLGVAHTREEN